MSTGAMVTVYTDVPFETDDEVSSRLAHYEELFSNRYTKEDDWYSRTCQRTGRSPYLLFVTCSEKRDL